MNAPRLAPLLLALAAACGRPAAWPPAAVDADLGHDACAGCRMLVSDARFVAQRHERDGTVEFFDDLGCLVTAHGGDECDPDSVFVRSFDDARWIRGDEGFVVRSAAFASPMGFGAAVFPTRAAAEAEARAHPDARLLELASLLRHGPQGVPP